MKKIQINIDWSVVFWVSIIILFLWLLAKAVGLIHTPWFILAIPYIVSFMAFVAGVKKIAEYAFKVDTLVIDMKDLKFEIKGVRQDIHSLDKRITVVESKI